MLIVRLTQAADAKPCLILHRDAVEAKIDGMPAGHATLHAAGNPRGCPGVRLYPVHTRIRNFSGLMTRKLSVTELRNCAQFCGTFSRRKVSAVPANSRGLW